MKNSLLQPYLNEVTVVFAHPDDELLYFYQLIKFLQPLRLRLICVTGHFTRDGEEELRLSELAAAAEHLGGELINLGLEDRLQKPLDTEVLLAKLKLINHREGSPVFTHGPFGEYGHRHHVDVFRAVQQCFGCDVWCVSGPLEADVVFSLTEQEITAKRAVIEQIYVSQTIQEFVSKQECFTHVSDCVYADVLLSVCGGKKVTRNRVMYFFEHVERVYFNAKSLMPFEAQAAVTGMGLENVCQLLRYRVEDWQDWLKEFTAENIA